ncbi:hypothetical protein FKM82_008735 [Ascaphus truei]
MIYWMPCMQKVMFYEMLMKEVILGNVDIAEHGKNSWVFTHIYLCKFEVKNLKSCTRYFVCVRAVNIAGSGQWSNPCMFLTTCCCEQTKSTEDSPVTVSVQRCLKPKTHNIVFS